MFPIFVIFSGHFKQDDVMWIEACQSLQEAFQHMLQIAAQKPASYFIFGTETQTCLASVDTSEFSQARISAPEM